MLQAVKYAVRQFTHRRRIFVRPLMAIILVAGTGFAVFSGATDDIHMIPAFASTEPPAKETASEVAVLAGGCFWGVQGVFQHVKGVTGAISGYAGGDKEKAHYDAVGTGMTGHAESVRITFDPRQISYGRILQIYFSVAHDPTQLNRQGPDSGSQYRSAIFPLNREQQRIAKAYIDQLDRSHAFHAAIVTRIETDRPFYAAEDYHQDFLAQHPNYPYIVINDLPKVEGLKRLFPDLYRTDPVLVSAARR